MPLAVEDVEDVGIVDGETDGGGDGVHAVLEGIVPDGLLALMRAWPVPQESMVPGAMAFTRLIAGTFAPICSDICSGVSTRHPAREYTMRESVQRAAS
jgi:hypothetical protein